jgi:hypothetical protein
MVIEIQAQLPLGLVTDQRAQLDLIEGFAARLRDKQTDVRSSAGPSTSNPTNRSRAPATEARHRLADVPKFSLRIARPL